MAVLASHAGCGTGHRKPFWLAETAALTQAYTMWLQIASGICTTSQIHSDIPVTTSHLFHRKRVSFSWLSLWPGLEHKLISLFLSLESVLSLSSLFLPLYLFYYFLSFFFLMCLLLPLFCLLSSHSCSLCSYGNLLSDISSLNENVWSDCSTATAAFLFGQVERHWKSSREKGRQELPSSFPLTPTSLSHLSASECKPCTMHSITVSGDAAAGLI